MGGTRASGGALATGGAVATGGKATAGGAVATGGSPATGGAMTTTGGAKTTGGATATGGAKATGGSIATGGSPATGGGVSTSCGAGTSTSSDVVVNLNGVQQKISGFGASTAWGSTMSAADADLLWSTTSGAGLSLHRIRIAPDGTTTETNIAKLAVARGVTVWATPWSPAASYKSNGNVNGGTIVDGSRQAWANSMAKFVTTMAAAGVNIYAVSAQNEPDATVSTYESCTYTAAALATFIGTYLGPALANSGVKLMGPETQNWCGFKSYADAIMNNSAAASAVSIIATHEYGCADTAHVVPYTTGISAGKEFWETEIYDQGSTTADPGMGSALRVVTLIHNAIAVANMNAWHYWWVYPNGAGNGALWNYGTNQATKRLYVMGNYSRFVRPGYQRVSTTGTVPSGVLISAYKNAADNTVAVVAVNNNNSATSLSVYISGAAPCSVTPWVTSSTDSLASKTAVSVAGSRFTFSLGAQSVTTFVGKP